MKTQTIAILITLLTYCSAASADSQQDSEFIDFCTKDTAMSGEIFRASSACGFPAEERRAISTEFSQSSVECKKALGGSLYNKLHSAGASNFDQAVRTQGKQRVCSAHLQAVRDSFMSDKQPDENSLAPANGISPSFCEDRLSIHGLLTVAQVECNFSQYSNELVQIGQACNAQLGEERTTEILKFGIREFYRNANEQGKAKLCNELLIDFPQFVRK